MFTITEHRSSTATIYGVILIIIFALNLSGCEDSGSVGSSFPGAGAQVAVDTLALNAFQTQALPGRSGRLPFISAGQFTDPVFGTINARALVKPTLPSSDDLSFDANSRMQLRLAINKNLIYGDTLGAQRYDIVELGEVFRSNQVDINERYQTTNTTVGSFEITDDDTLLVDLSDEWKQKYADFYNDTTAARDSLYRRTFPGLAIVPQNGSKVIPFSAGRTYFVATNLNVSPTADSTVTDSTWLNLGESAYTLERENELETTDSDIIYNTLEQVFWFTFAFTNDNLGARNISQVKLVFYRDNAALEAQPLPTGVVRQMNTNLGLHLVDTDELPQSIDPGTPFVLPPIVNDRTTGFYQSDDGAYYIDITNAVLNRRLDNVGENERFYITFGRNIGAIQSSIIFNSSAGDAKSPKVIVTSTKTDSN